MYAIKRELKLNKKQTSLMRSCAGFKRLVYNFGLSMVCVSWSFESVKMSDSKRIDVIRKVFTSSAIEQPENAWMKQYPSTIYQSAFINLKDAFARWRKGLSGFPQFKSKKKGDSFTVYKTSGVYPEKGQPALPFTNRAVINVGKRIKLPSMPELRLKEKIDFICSSQTFTVSRSADKWFVAFVLDAEKIPPIIHPVEKIGVDLGVKTLATCSDGSTFDMPISTKIAKTKLSKIQWHNRKKVIGNRKKGIKTSNNARKAFDLIARKHSRIANTRQDTTQKMTTKISRKAFVIRIEDLNVSGMLANHKLARAVSNNCFYEIRRQLIYKQSHYGTKVEIVDRWYPSSKTCSKCGHVQAIPLSQRIFDCEKCDHIQDRDENAAINLELAPLDKIRLA